MANLLGTLITGNLRTTQGYGTSDSTRILYPGGGSFVTTTSVITGAIRIKMPVFGSGMMMTCTVKVYEYSTNKSFTITFGGHRDAANWYNEFCYIDGGTTRTNLTVRFGIDDGVNCVWIGETSSSWSYPQVFVTDAQLGYVGYSTSWLSGWAVDFVTAFGSVARTQIAYAKITTANIGSQSVSYASTSGTFSTDWTNYKGVTDNAVAGQLMWKNYGNNHTIFDASNSTSPTGSAVNNTNSAIAWTGTYPTLMGWNGSSTYGVRVDSARVADGLTSMNISQFTNDSGYLTSASVGNMTRLWAESHPDDYYVRANWTGSYWQLTSNHPSPVQVGYADNAGNSATTSQRDFSGDISTSGMGRFAGWYTGNAQTGLAAEIGTSGGQVYIIAYNRQSGAYGTLNLESTGTNLRISGSTVNVTSGTLQQGGNAVIHAGNIGSQSVSYATSAGSSSTADSAGSVDGLTLTSSANNLNPDNVTQNQIGYNTSVSLFGQTDGGLYSSAYSSSWIHQIYGDFRTGQIAIRGKNSGTWGDWRIVVDDRNIASYAVPYGNMTSSTGLNDNKLYLRTNGDNNHYIWNAADDWEEIVAYSGTGLRIKSSTGVTLATFTTSGNSMNITGNSATTSQIVFSDLKINFPSGAGGGHSFASNHYSMGLDSGNGGWDHPHYRDVIIGYHTGIRIGAHYSGVRFYSDSPTTDANNDGNGDGTEKLLMTVGGYVGTANHTDVVVNNNLFANVSMRAPIFYDSENTAYYVDPNSTGTSLNIAGGIVTTAPGGSVLLKHAVAEVDAWLFQENAANWGLYWKNNPTGNHTFGGYTTVGAELFGMSAANISGNGVLTTNFVGATSAYAQYMLSNYTGYIWSASTIFAAGDMRAPIFYDSANTAYYVDPNATSNIFDLSITGGAHKYLTINPGNGYEAMVRYVGGTGSSWYVGKRTSAQLIGTESFHFYSEATGATVGGINPSGDMIVTGSMRAPQFRLTNSTNNAYLTGADEWGIRMVNDSGYIQFGPANSSWAHIYSGMPFYFNQELYVNGTQLVKNSGTWGINVTGDAGSVDGVDSSRIVFGDGERKTTRLGDMNTYNQYSGFFYENNPANGPFADWTNWINVMGALWASNYGFQLAHQFHGDGFAVRRVTNGTFYSWRSILDSENFTTWAQQKENQRLSTGNSPTFADIYADNWFRNNNVNEGLYNQATGTHFYSHSIYGFSVTGSGSTVELVFRSNHQTAARGYVYADTSNNIGFLNNGGNWSLRCDSSGNVTATGDVTAYSDARLKTGVNTIEGALEKVLQMRGVTYVRTDNNDTKEKVGVIAQEIQQVLPQVVQENTDGYLTVSYGNIVGVLIEAIKEQQKQIDELKAKLDGLTK